MYIGYKVVPKTGFQSSLTHGKVIAGATKAWIGNTSGQPIDLTAGSLPDGVFKRITNPPRTPADDTPEKWKACGNGIATYDVDGQLKYQPKRWGFVLNLCDTDSDIAQIWVSACGNVVGYRSGDVSGWWANTNHNAGNYGHWRILPQVDYGYTDSTANVINNPSAPPPYANMRMKLNSTSKRERTFLTIREGTSDGDAVIIGAAGLTIIGGGESPSTMFTRLNSYEGVAPQDERMYVCSDTGIYFVTNAQTTQNDVTKPGHVTCEIDKTGKMTAPGGFTGKLVNCPGGTLTDHLNFSKTKMIVFNASDDGWCDVCMCKMKGGYTTKPINLFESGEYGAYMAVGAGGNTILGGGESATNLIRALVAEDPDTYNNSERAFLSADSDAHIVTNCQKIAERKTFTFTAGGNATFPGTLTANKFSGPLTGNVTGNCSGSSASCTGNAATATKLATARNITVNLASTTAASFNGTANVTPGISGTLAVGHGGTGNTTGYVRIGNKSGSNIGSNSTVEGKNNICTGGTSHAEGLDGSCTGSNAHSEGYGCKTSGNAAHSEGNCTEARNYASHSEGMGCIASENAMSACGWYNTVTNNGTIFVVGRGDSNTARSNIFRVTDARCYSTSSSMSTGADYAEMFQWEDDNPENEDRVGRFVTLDGERIRYATSADDFVLGVISGNPSVVGDVHDDEWKDRFLKDIYGRVIWEEIDVEKEYPEDDPNTHKKRRMKMNPDYDPNKEYIPRSDRPEWDTVGLMGKLVAIDDGTASPNDWIMPGESGIGTKSNTPTKFRMMSRIDDTHIRVLILY